MFASLEVNPFGATRDKLRPTEHNRSSPSCLLQVEPEHDVMIAITLGLALLGAEPNSGLIKPGASLEKLWSEGTFTEGGAWSGEFLLFSDIGDRILKFDPKTGKVTPWREPSGRANGLIFDRQGRLLAAEGASAGGGRRVSITGRDGTVRILADRFEGKRFNSPNDLAVDRLGRIYVSDPRYGGDEPR